MITKKSTNADENEKSGTKDEKNNEWEDVDVESDDNDVEIESDEEDEKKEEKSDSEVFSIISDSKGEGSSSAQFQNITGSANSHNIPHDANIVGEDSLSSIKGGEEGKKKKGMTREEAMLGLKIKPAQLLETGEVLLGNGKIIGTRALKYVYKQRFRFPDQREAVVVNKLALEYRKIQAITNGIVEETNKTMKGGISQEVIKNSVLKWKKAIAYDLRVEMRKNKTISRPAI